MIKFYFEYLDECHKGIYNTFEDESIVFETNIKSDFTIILNNISFALDINTSKKEIINFSGYTFGFTIGDFKVPKSNKGRVFYINELSDAYCCPNFLSMGKYRIDGWYMVGDNSKICDVIEVCDNTYINLVNNQIATVYFKIKQL